MPKAKKKKGKKKSKEELEAERVAQEEAERVEREAEEARVAEEKRLAEEELRRKAEEAAAARAAELERLDAEQEASEEADAAHRAAAAEWTAKLAEKEEWERYRSSDGGFDISQESQLNAFLSDVTSSDYGTLQAGAAAVESITKLTQQLVLRKQKALEAKDDAVVAQSLQVCSNFEAAVSKTLDSMMAKLVDQAKVLSKGKPEFHDSITTPSVDIALWMNVVPKGYRPRLVKYDDLGLSVTIPRNLMSLTLAARTVVYRNGFRTRLLSPAAAASATAAAATAADNAAGDAAGAGAATAGAVSSAVLLPLTDEQTKKVMERAAQLHEAWRAPRALPDGTFKPRISRAAGGAKQDIANTSFADLSDADQAPFVADAEFVERWLSAIGAATEFTAYGPTIQFDIIDLPAQSRQLKKWQVRAVVEGLEGTVKRRTYPLEGTPAGQVVPPIKFSLKVPESVRVHSNETPMVGVWDAASRSWSVDNVSEVSFNPEDRILKFQAVGVGLISLVQPRSVDIPLQHWEIKRLNFKGAVRVSLRTARGLCVDIKVHNDGCSLIVNTEGEHATPSEIRHLAGRKFGARQIFEELAHAGLNFLLQQRGPKARVTAAVQEPEEDNELPLSQPLQTRDFTLTPSANASVDERSSESGFDACSEGGPRRARGSSGGSGATMFNIDKYIWASNTLREDYDSVGLKGMETMYFVEPEVASLLERCFGERRVQPRLSTTSTASHSEEKSQS
eukprot:INCI17603.6.p1 GENE.INCI17603.6~~INCI17603.6.p1  ORF type:complete len:734 (+),score=175.87 INCI17603.6:134-2335(+)